MLITTLSSPEAISWPGPVIKVIKPELASLTRVSPQISADRVEFVVLDPSISDVALLQHIVVKLSVYRQLGSGPLLYCKKLMGDDEVRDLHRKVLANPDLVDLHLHNETGEIMILVVGANLVKNLLFTRFFANLSHVGTLPPDFLASQMRRHLAKADTFGEAP